MGWTIRGGEGAGVATFESLGLSGLKRTQYSEGEDVVSFYQAIENTADPALFDEDEEVFIFLDGVKWFEGKNLTPRRRTDARTKRIEYTVVGPWRDLTRLVFQQGWNGQFTSHLLLNIGAAGLLSVRQQIEVVLDYAIAQGVRIQKGQILPEASENATPPANEIVSHTCAAVILNQLRWLLRQGIIFWDYSTDPPTIHIRAGNKLAAVTVDIPADDNAKTIVGAAIDPRPDLILRGVVIVYEITSVIDGEVFQTYFIDKYPAAITGRELDVVHLTFDMRGVSLTRISQEVETIAIDASNADDATKLNWWRERLPDLRHPSEVRNLQISDVARGSALPNMLVFGVVAEWMRNGAGAPITFQEEIITAKATYERWSLGTGSSGADEMVFKGAVPISTKVTATDAATGVYTTTASEEAADPIPVGLAKFIYDLNSVLQWEGTVRIKEQSLRYPKDTVPRLGTRVNITGGLPEWATMNAVVQRVDQDAQMGETVLTLQPISLAVAADLMEFLRVRRRQRWTNPLTQQDGKSRANDVVLPPGTAKENSVDGQPSPQVQSVHDATHKIEQNCIQGKFLIQFPDGKIVHIAKDVGDWGKGPGTPGGRTLKVKEVEVCVDGVTRKMLVIGSDPY